MKILYIFSSPRRREETLIEERSIPSDRLYMAIELRKLGHRVDIDEDRYHGILGRVAKWIRRYLHVNTVGLKTLLRCRKYDVVVLKDEFCTVLSIACWLWRVRLVNLDSLGIVEFPRAVHRRLEHRLNLALADSVITYSRAQIDGWSAKYRIPREKFVSLPYAIDVEFYDRNLASLKVQRSSDPYVLSVGCDPGRDFHTLLGAVRCLGVKLKLVSVPSMVTGKHSGQDAVEYYSGLSYEELFHLYANACFVVIPILPGTVYPCGVRGLLEAMALGKAVIVSRTPILEEYCRDGVDVVMVKPGDECQLLEKMRVLREDSELCRRLGENARKKVRESYDIRGVGQQFAGHLEKADSQSLIFMSSGEHLI